MIIRDYTIPRTSHIENDQLHIVDNGMRHIYEGLRAEVQHTTAPPGRVWIDTSLKILYYVDKESVTRKIPVVCVDTPVQSSSKTRRLNKVLPSRH